MRCKIMSQDDSKIFDLGNQVEGGTTYWDEKTHIQKST